ncbi:UbiD family decarboxylase domain-containing protein [Planctomicrobium sp. SH664]|uniref:UbiD family decarboxylase domain-containing protein n=1 Tax=Planctomicrobium sp. SH664 TaxID=3448125 RepID=UPI003F5B46C1
MAFEDLTQFLQAAADSGDLIRIPAEVDPVYELAALSEQLVQFSGEASPVLLFERVQNSDIPVVTNLLGSLPRFLRALRADSLGEVVSRLTQALNPFPTGRDWTFGLAAGAAGDKARFAPRVVRRGLCQQVIKLGKDLDLGELPALQSWEGESNRALTAAQTIVAGPDGKVSVESVPVEILAKDTVQLHWQRSSPSYRLLQECQAAHRQLPVAITLGGDPLCDYAATLPIPRFLDPWLFAGILRNESVSLIRGRSVELDLPASAELVLEGYIDPAPAAGRGVLADRSGILRERTDLPIVQLSALTHRANPLLPAAIRSFATQEDGCTSALTELLALQLLRLWQPAIVDLHLPRFGRFAHAVIVSVEESSAPAVAAAVSSIGSLPLTSPAQLVVVVEASVNVRDLQAVWQEVSDQPVVLESAAVGQRTVLNATGNRRSQRARPPGRTLEQVRATMQALGLQLEGESHNSEPASQHPAET